MENKNKALSFLPLCHIFERIIIYMYYYSRVEIYFAESLETISENLKEVKPFYMTAVPRLIEKIFDKIESKAAFASSCDGVFNNIVCTIYSISIISYCSSFGYF